MNRFCTMFSQIIFGLLSSSVALAAGFAEPPDSDQILYENALNRPQHVRDWVMEGQGTVRFENGWMEMYSPHEAGDHVFWCPKTFPDRFIAEWEAQNMDPKAGLCIVFFAAAGENGIDIFDRSLPKRDGSFEQYINGKINSYHISYYANTPRKPARPYANLRKNTGFNLVSQGHAGIPAQSSAIHQLRLVKNGPDIEFYVDGRSIIRWTDDGRTHGPVLRDGKVGFRQMRWTGFRYRKFRVIRSATGSEGGGLAEPGLHTQPPYSPSDHTDPGAAQRERALRAR